MKLGKHGATLAKVNRKAADAHAKALRSTLRELQDEGLSLRDMVMEFNKRGIPTGRSGRWHLATVQRVLARLGT